MRDWPRHDLLRHRAATTPDRVALLDPRDDTCRTWAALDSVVGRQATTLDDYVDPGDRVGLLLDTSTGFVDAYWTVLRLGASVVPVDPARGADTIGDRFRRAGVTCVIGTPATAGKAETATEAPILSMTPADPATVPTLEPGPGPTPPADRHHRDEQAVVFTSGSTGDPKGVRLTDGNLLASAIGSAIRLGVDPTDRWLDCLPMYHMGGLAPIVRTAVYGTTLVVQPTFDVHDTAAILRNHDITGVSMVPTMLRRLLDTDWRPPPTLETVLLGGAPAGRPVLEEALARDIPIYVTYGLTEAASQVATAPPDVLADHPDTVGYPLFLTDVTIVDDDGRVCSPGEVGELMVDGPTVTSAYLDRDRTRTGITDHGLATGDLASRDEDGRVYIHGRLDDRILTGGETVHPATVVETLRTHADIEDAAVVGLDDPEWGQRVAALVVPTPATDLSAEEVRTHCRDHVAGFECPKTIAFTDSLPRTASGTVDRAAVREQLNTATTDDQI